MIDVFPPGTLLKRRYGDELYVVLYLIEQSVTRKRYVSLKSCGQIRTIIVKNNLSIAFYSRVI